MAPQRPRVLIVDDHPVVRMGLRPVIEQSGRYEVCGEAGAPVEAQEDLHLAPSSIRHWDRPCG
jgi:DNA-binding NarL/FixJ family response regulator